MADRQAVELRDRLSQWRDGRLPVVRGLRSEKPRGSGGAVEHVYAAGVDDIGMYLLDSHAPLLAAPKEHKRRPWMRSSSTGTWGDTN